MSAQVPSALTGTSGRLERRHRVWLIAILSMGFVLRLAFLLNAVGSPGYTWQDPDGYLKQALHLIDDGDWTWTVDAVTYSINEQLHALPPGYSVFLSLFALFPGFPFSAQVAQVVLGTIAIVLVFELGSLVHTRLAGLMASGAFALWVPGVLNAWSTSQESLYVPLILLGFVALGRGLAKPQGIAWFGVGGLVFAIAALTRSMPIFFVVPLALLHVALAPERRRAVRQAGAFLGAFLLLTVPYVVGLSLHFGQLTVIDSHGSIHLDAATGHRAPGIFETAAALGREMAMRPIEYLGECVGRARSLLHVNGGRQLQIYVVAETKLQAVIWKAFVHGGTDVLLLVTSSLAVLGAALCRRPHLAAMILLWTAVNIGIASVGGFGGARLRVPFEPLLMVLAAVVVTGGWQRPRTIPLGAGVLAAIVAVLATAPQFPRSLRSWPDYGVTWPSIFSRKSGTFTGRAGLNVPVVDNMATVHVSTAPGAAPTRVGAQVDGVVVRRVELGPGEQRAVRVLSPEPGLVFVELEATDSVLVRVAKPSP